MVLKLVATSILFNYYKNIVLAYPIITLLNQYDIPCPSPRWGFPLVPLTGLALPETLNQNLKIPTFSFNQINKWISGTYSKKA